MILTPLRKLIRLGAFSGSPAVEDTATGNPVTFLTDLARPLKSLLVAFSPQQTGSGDPSPENIRPILPWDGLTVWQAGQNLLNPAWWNNIADNKSYVRYEDGTLVYQAGTYKASDYVSVIGNTEYTLHAVMYGQNAGGIAFYDSSKQYISGIRINSGTTTDHTFTTPSNAVYMRFWDASDKMPWNEVMLVYGSTAPTTYEPYITPTETDIVFPSPVYGGNAEIISGVLTDNYNAVEPYDIREYISYNSTYNVFVFKATSAQKPTPKNNFKCLCNAYKYGGGYWQLSDKEIGYIFDNQFAVRDDSFSGDVSAFGASLEGVIIAYEVAEPQTVQLTAEQITALIGDNTLWSDADGNLTVTFMKKG